MPLHTLQIAVLPSPETNDHQVRFLIDDDDVISRNWGAMLGLDPDDILIEPCPLRAHTVSKTIILARCSCGVVGCDHRTIEIVRTVDHVAWQFEPSATVPTQQSFHFHPTTYNFEIERALHDTTWETPDRTAARLLVTAAPHGKLAESGLTYEWASGRIRNETLTLSLKLVPGPYQILVHIPWKHESPSQIATRAAHILTQTPSTWSNVQWHQLAPHLGAPSIAGPNW